MAVKVVCFGSLNHDLTVWVPRHPRPDETLRAHRVEAFLGGKGANQATAAARIGAATTMIGCVGADAAGEAILAGLDRNHVDRSLVETVEEHTGVAIPIVTDDGEVSIIIVPGANAALTAAHADRAADAIAAADVLLLQGEVAVAASVRAAEIAVAAGTTVVCNPAPVPDGAKALLDLATIVVANREEAAELALERGPGVVVTEGATGAWAGDQLVPAFAATVVDPTAAGDAFCAAFAVATAEGMSLAEAVRFGCAAGAVAVSTAGAEPSLPSRAQIDAILGATREPGRP